MMKAVVIAGMSGLATAQVVTANEYEPALRTYLESEIVNWASSDVIISAITAQNQVTSGYTQARVEAMDTAWRSELGGAETPTITPVVTGRAADFLREQVSASGGRITEIFLMDARGLNVAASDITSDYWQGDEAKFSETFARGGSALHFSEIELDESTQRYQAQISLTITDPATGQPIGAMTVGIDADALM